MAAAVRRLLALASLGLLLVAAAAPPGLGVLERHQLPTPPVTAPDAPATDPLPTVTPPATPTEAPAPPALPGAPSTDPATAASVTGAPPSTSPSVPPPPAVPVGLPLADTAPPLPVDAGVALDATQGFDVHDALLLATGSAAGLSLASPPTNAQGLLAAKDGAKDAATKLVKAVDALIKSPIALSDLQKPLVKAAQLAGLPGAAETKQRTGLRGVALERSVGDLYDALELPVSPTLRAQLHETAGAVDPALAQPVSDLVGAIADAQRTMAEQLHRLSPADLRLLVSCLPQPGGEPLACTDLARAHDIATRQLDRGAMLQASLRVVGAVNDALPALRDYAAQGLQRTAGEQEPPLFRDPTGLVEITGWGSTVFDHNDLNGLAPIDSAAQVFTLDLGGNDAYLTRAGGTAPSDVSQMQATAGDLQASQSNSYALGTLVSVSVDLGGDDSYTGVVNSQGAGALGFGLLVEVAGSDSYSASSQAQGAGSSGIGMLVDLSGNDAYTSNWRSQGYGTVGGLGVLAEAGGDDRYTGQVWTQGVGENEGEGFLLDAAGSDAYSASCSGRCLSQGATDRLGLGVFADGSGLDRYSVTSGGRGYVNPMAAPYGVGTAAFLDAGGLDAYVGAPGGNGLDWFQGNLGVGMDKTATG